MRQSVRSPARLLGLQPQPVISSRALSLFISKMGMMTRLRELLGGLRY